MKPKIVVVCKIAVWVILMFMYLKVALFSVDNRFAYAPDWSVTPTAQQNMSTELNCAAIYDVACVVNPIANTHTGWPLQTNPEIEGNPNWLIWTVNGVVMAIFGGLIAFLLIKFPRSKCEPKRPRKS